MAFTLGRAAGGAARRIAGPLAGAASPSGLFAKISHRPSFRVSDTPLQKIEEEVNGWTLEEMVSARGMIDARLASKGLAVIKTGHEEQMMSRLHTILTLQRELNLLSNKKGDITAIPIGNSYTINGISVLTLGLKIGEHWSTVEAWIRSFL